MNAAEVVLDSWALLAWLEGEEPAATEVNEVLEEAAAGRVIARMSIINLGEIYYLLARRKSLQHAREVRGDLESGPIRTMSAVDDRVWSAAELKAAFRMSYADAFAAALAIESGAELLTGDPEFDALEVSGLLRLRRLTRRPEPT